MVRKLRETGWDGHHDCKIGGRGGGRADPARGRRTGGSGLGLAIARQIAGHCGFIAVSSAMGAGTTFTITLPAAG